MHVRTVSLIALAVAALLAVIAVIAAPVFAAKPAAVPKPKVVTKYIRYGSARKAQMAAYSRRHYGQRAHLLKRPRAVVLHHTAGANWRSAWNTFNANTAYSGEKPGVSAQFIVGKDGTIYQLMPLNLRARHCIGMNWTAFGIEFVQEPRAGKDGHWMDRQILARKKQVDAGLRLVRWLRYRYGIKKVDVVGHATANRSRFFKDRTGIKNAAGDWYAAEVKVFRARL